MSAELADMIALAESGVRVSCSAEQIAAWSKAAGETPIAEWLAQLADDEATEEVERTWPFVVTLKYPVQFGSELISTLEFRCGRLADLKGIKVDDGGVPLDQLMIIASRMCTRPLKVIEMLTGADGAEAMAVARDFFTESLTGGGTR